MRVLVTGGAGFIGSQFVRRLVDAGDSVAVLDKLTYAGNRANLEGVEHDFFHGAIEDPEAVARAAKGTDAIVNFAAETHVDRSILGPAEFILTTFAISRSRPTRSTATSISTPSRARRTRPSGRRARTPHRRPAATCRCSPTCARTARTR